MNRSRWKPLKMLCLPLILFLAADGLAGQTKRSSSPLKYDVVTVKNNKTDERSMVFRYDRGALLEITNATLETMLEIAFNKPRYMIEKVPSWGNNLHYDVRGKILDATVEQISALTDSQRRQMIADVLRERFGLKTHWEVRDEPQFDLLVTKSGSKLRESASKQTSLLLTMNELDAKFLSTDDLAKSLASRLGRSVIDKTWLTGKYDVHLKWGMYGHESEDDSGAPSIFTAVKETLGLELKTTRGSEQVLLVDFASPPGEN